MPSNNRSVVPEAKQALDNMKYEVANSLNVNYSKGYKGDLTARQNGSVGGYMVKKMIEQYERSIGNQ
ncbi:MAG TPA: alpha/beta-type small acid-soluble spore protein [Clostridia bacterium]|nr:alpha/beta-type small acid-soluble spore protein [Clostridia bacterium]